MAAINRESFGSKESALGIRTISREIVDGNLVHKRMVRGESFDIERQSGPGLDRLASGLYLEGIPGEEGTRVPSLFKFTISVPREGLRKDDRREVRLKVKVEAIIRAISNVGRLDLIVIGSGVEIDYMNIEISSWRDVEIEYLTENRTGTIWFMKETTDPLPMEVLTFDEVYSILRGRLGAMVRVYDPDNFTVVEYKIVKEGERLIVGVNSPVEHCGHSIFVGVSQSQEKPGLIESYAEKPHAIGVIFPDLNLPYQQPYILANGEIHLTSLKCFHFTFSPPETA